MRAMLDVVFHVCILRCLAAYVDHSAAVAQVDGKDRRLAACYSVSGNGGFTIMEGCKLGRKAGRGRGLEMFAGCAVEVQFAYSWAITFEDVVL